jgi:hypothetical protein
MTEHPMTDATQERAGDYERAYFERGMFAAYAWMVTKRAGAQLSDAVVDHAWDNRDAGMGPTECLPTRAEPKLAAVDHPLDSASLREVFDYAARRLSDASEQAEQPREYRLSVDRFDEAYMWLVAAEEKSA